MNPRLSYKYGDRVLIFPSAELHFDPTNGLVYTQGWIDFFFFSSSLISTNSTKKRFLYVNIPQWTSATLENSKGFLTFLKKILWFILVQMCWDFIGDTKALVCKIAGASIQIKVIALNQWCFYYSTSCTHWKKQTSVSLNNALDAEEKYCVRQNSKDT